MYWADGEAEIDIGLSDEIDGLHCSRYTSLTFVERLFELAAEVGLVMVADSDPMFFVTYAELIPHLPADIRDHEEPAVVHSAKELIEMMVGFS